MPLTPSERVFLIKEASGRLAQEEWPLIDLTLRQFSLPTTDGWSSDKFRYLVEMLEGCEDSKLTDLALHVGIKTSQQSRGIDPPFWRAGMLRLFISHLTEYRTLAAGLQQEFWRYGISAFVAHNDIEPTREWQAEIETALSTCHALVALLHPGFHASNWTDQEIGFAMGRGVPVFAVRFGQDPYGFIGRLQAFQGAGKAAGDIAGELFACYAANRETEGVLAEALVALFEQSTSFSTARERLGYLENLRVWRPEFCQRLRDAERANAQVSGSSGVPERIRELLGRWEALAR